MHMPFKYFCFSEIQKYPWCEAISGLIHKIYSTAWFVTKRCSMWKIGAPKLWFQAITWPILQIPTNFN